MKVEWKACLRVGVSAFILFLAIYYWQGAATGIKLFLSAATPLLIGCIIAYILNIPMSFYERHFFPRSRGRFVGSIRRPLCMAAAVFTVLGVMAGVVGLIIPELTECITLLITTILPDVIRWIADLVADSESLAQIIPLEYLEKLETVDWQKWLAEIVSFLGTGIGGAVGTAVGAISSVFSGVVTAVLGLIFALYLLLGKDHLLDQGGRLMKHYLPAGMRERISHVLTVLNDCFHRYVVGQCLEAVILGSLCILGMWIFRFPYATMIGTLIGFTALIPVAGAYIGAVVGAVMILTVSPIQAIFFVLFLTILQQLEGNLIYPKVVGTSIGLPGIWVLAAVTVGGGLMGVAGMLIGVPLAAAVYRLLRDDVRKREGKERAAVSRKRRENREKKLVKDAKSSAKTMNSDINRKVEKPAKKTEVKSNTIPETKWETKQEIKPGTKPETKAEKEQDRRQNPDKAIKQNSAVKQEERAVSEMTVSTEKQEEQKNAHSSNGRRRRRRKNSRKSGQSTQHADSAE
ncbi:MAG: AI-2E family transporter [Lachnospiraceae bacterium]|nr:AI-2E family transporter [Lachnospiraceae bacterium]